MRRTSLKSANCPVARSLDVIGDWWSLLIVRDALRGLHRFSQFQKSLGLARNILTTRLRGLVADGILDVVPAADGSAYQDYLLTPKGRDLLTVLVALRQWGMRNFPNGGPWGTDVVDRDSGHRVTGLVLTADDGTSVSPDSVEFRPAAGEFRPAAGSDDPLTLGAAPIGRPSSRRRPASIRTGL
jgi:DNA-binding HxlR family transcriptional regulator